MKYFKAKPSRLAKRYEITPKTYNEIIQHKYPFERVNADKIVSQYAICPSRLNPIQIIGIAKKNENNSLWETYKRMDNMISGGLC